MLKLSVLEIISIITAFQLLMLGLVLLVKGNRLSNRILSLFMFSNSLLIIFFLILILDLFSVPSIPVFYYLLGPLMFLYVRSMCEKNFKLKGSQLIHGLIFILMILYIFMKGSIIKNSTSASWKINEDLITQSILHAQIVFYVIASFRSLYLYRMEIKNHFSTIEEINLSWLILIIVAFTAMWLADFIIFILTNLGIGSYNTYYTLFIISILINFLFANFVVYKGLRQADTYSGLKVPEKYSGSRITESESELMANRLKIFMLENKPYLNPDLTIKDLSDQFNMHHKYLSQVINSQFGQNFYDFINQFRVQEAKNIILNSTDKRITILEILYEVGFNSKSAFNNAFKKSTGKTPTEFKKLAS